MIAERLQVSLPLALLALLLAIAMALPAGLHAAAGRGRTGDVLARGVVQFGIALPNFWLAMLLVLVFAVRLRWLPAGGFPGWADPLAALRSLILPGLALALLQAAILGPCPAVGPDRRRRGQGYIRTARARG